MILGRVLKAALLLDDAELILKALKTEMSKSGWNEQDLKAIVDKSIEFYENIEDGDN